MTRPQHAQRDRGTTIGVALFSWQPYVEMGLAARALWLALYASPEARRCPVGLWHGGPAVMAEAASMRMEDVAAGLAELVAAELVEYDPITRVARLTRLPDRCERPDNGKVLRSWWTRWSTVPACAVRDRHVALLRWLVGGFTGDHETAWAETFGQVETDRIPNGIGYGIRDGGGDVVTADVGHLGDRIPNGSRYPRGEGEVSSSLPDPDRTRGTSREISNSARDPGAPVLAVVASTAADPLAARDAAALAELEAHAPGIADLAKRALARYGPKHAPEVPEGFSAVAGSFR